MTDTHHSSIRSLSSVAAVVLFALLASGCAEDRLAQSVGEAIEREVFIEAYIDLRVAALSADPQELSDEARAEVLSKHGITADALMTFGEVHGRNLEFMREVWNEIETRMDGLMPDGTG